MAPSRQILCRKIDWQLALVTCVPCYKKDGVALYLFHTILPMLRYPNHNLASRLGIFFDAIFLWTGLVLGLSFVLCARQVGGSVWLLYP